MRLIIVPGQDEKQGIPSSGKQSHKLSKTIQQLFDKTFKEVLKKASIDLLQVLLGLEVHDLQPLDREFTRLEATRKHLDFLARVTFPTGNSGILHLEIQTTNDPLMHIRMLSYALDIYREHSYPMQVLLYLGNEPLTMKNHIKEETNLGVLTYRYTLLNAMEFSPESFLSHDNPDVLILAALAIQPRDSKASEVYESILSKLTTTVKGHELLDYLARLEIFAVLRKTLIAYEKVMKMFEVDVEELKKSELFQLGEKEGLEKGLKEGLEKGLKKGRKEGSINTILLIANEKFNLGKRQKIQLKKALEDLTETQLNTITVSLFSINSYNDLMRKIMTMNK